MLELASNSPLAQVLARHGLCLDLLQREASAIALFGSRAHGCERPSSDWDLLCVGEGRSRRIEGLDLVWVDASSVERQDWLGGDLAGHVAAYGTWIHGAPSWRHADVRFDIAARRKEERLFRRLRSLVDVWDLLGGAYRSKHAMLVRRDSQRLAELCRGNAVPPTAVLDTAWNEMEDAAAWLGEMLRSCRIAPRLAGELIEQATRGR